MHSDPSRPELGSSARPEASSCHQGIQLGEVFLETMSTGIITQAEIDWLTLHQNSFNREEEAKALRLGRWLDEGQIQIGCRLLGQQAPVAESVR